jgi:D-sedoheptulose 7-phosphate isomerase
MTFTKHFLSEIQQVAEQPDQATIEKRADELASLRERGGRLFILGVGGKLRWVTRRPAQLEAISVCDG